MITRLIIFLIVVASTVVEVNAAIDLGTGIQFIPSGTNLGIGTDSPAGLLDINGTMLATNGTFASTVRAAVVNGTTGTFGSITLGGGGLNAANGTYSNTVQARSFNGTSFNGITANFTTGNYTTVNATGDVNTGDLIATGSVNGTTANFTTVNASGVITGSQVNGTSAEFTNLVASNITLGDIDSANGSFTNIVNSPLFNGGNFNGGVANLTTGNFTGDISVVDMIASGSVNGANANFSGDVNTGDLIATGSVNGATANFTTYNGGAYNGESADFDGTITAATINGTTGNFTNFNLTGDLSVVDMIASGSVNGANANFSGDVNTGDLIATGSVNGTNATLSGDVNTGDLIASGSVNGTTANFTTINASGVITGAIVNGTDANFGDLTVTSTLVYDEIVSNTSSTSITVNWTTGNYQTVTLGHNTTFSFTDPANPGRFVLAVHQDGTGSRTATWPGSVLWPGGTPPVLSTAPSSYDIITCLFDGTNYACQAGLDFQ